MPPPPCPAPSPSTRPWRVIDAAAAPLQVLVILTFVVSPSARKQSFVFSPALYDAAAAGATAVTTADDTALFATVRDTIATSEVLANTPLAVGTPGSCSAGFEQGNVGASRKQLVPVVVSALEAFAAK